MWACLRVVRGVEVRFKKKTQRSNVDYCDYILLHPFKCAHFHLLYVATVLHLGEHIITNIYVYNKC